MRINISVIIRFARTIIEITDNEVSGLTPRLKMVTLHISNHEQNIAHYFSSSFIIPDKQETIFVYAVVYNNTLIHPLHYKHVHWNARNVLALSLMKRKNPLRKQFMSSFHKNYLTEDLILSSL
jgi:hypothetical protein